MSDHFRFFVFVGISMGTGCDLCMNFCVESAVVHYCIAYFTIKTINRIIRESNDRQIDRAVPFIHPYAFDEEHRHLPSKFDFTFVINHVKYQYGFSADSSKIYDEYLYKYSSKLPSLIFERTNTKDYKYTKSNESKLKQYEEKTAPNKLFLATATNWNCELTKEAYLWFAKKLDGYNSGSFSMSQNMLAVFTNGGRAAAIICNSTSENGGCQYQRIQN